jgi:hypothetical protein
MISTVGPLFADTAKPIMSPPALALPLPIQIRYLIFGPGGHALQPLPQLMGLLRLTGLVSTPMLGLHARHLCAVNGRAAQLFWVVEQAAAAHQDIAALWTEMSGNRRAGANWAAGVLLVKPGLPPHVTQAYAEEVFWLAIDPGTYRSLTLGRGLSPAGFETWIGNYYAKMLLA